MTVASAVYGARKRRNQNPLSIFAGLNVIWIDALGGTHLRDNAAGSISDGEAIEYAYDRGPDARNAVGQGLQTRPTYAAAAFGGRGAMHFHHSGFYRILGNTTYPAAIGNGSHALIVVAQVVSGSNNTGFAAIGWDQVGWKTSCVGLYSGKWWSGGAGDASGSCLSATSSNTSPHVFVKTYDGTNVKRYIDGTLDSTYAPGSSYALSAGYEIGSWFYTAASGSPLHVGEVIIVSGGSVSGGQVTSITNYAKNRWGF
ncbi:MAG: hypothetical protein J0L92_03595 [Deltaproteobacteria bacterium]|nr:hypothetical protein [Deltaproteobacteria bacterium]